jgi:hypothetical protein
MLVDGIEVASKVCKRCGIEKSLVEFELCRSVCLVCRGMQHRERYEKNKKDILARNVAWAKANPDRVKVHQRKYRDIHEEQMKESDKVRNKKYRDGHKEHCGIKSKEYYEAHKEELKEYKYNYYRLHKERISALNRLYNQTNREKLSLQRKKWHEANKDKVKEWNVVYHKRRQRELKYKVLTHYGNGKCACVQCGFDNIHALSIDHINGKGNEHRRQIKTFGGRFYHWLVANNYPEGFQTLCMNCQFIKKFGEQDCSPNNKIKEAVKVNG